MTSLKDAGPSYDVGVGADFSGENPDTEYHGDCKASQVGGCLLARCTVPANAPDAGSPRYPNAGAITVTTPAPMTFTILPSKPDGQYASAGGIQGTPIFAPGDVITVSAAGGDAPAFSAKTVIAPSAMTLTAPILSGSPASLTFSRAKDLPLTWTGGGPGLVEVRLSSYAFGVGSTLAVCRFPAAAGAAVVPVSVTSQLDRTDGSTIHGLFSVQPQNRTTVQAADWTFVLQVAATGDAAPFTTSD